MPGSNHNPARIFEILNCFQQSMALKGAIDLDLFTHIAGGAKSVSELAEKMRASERGVRVLCDYLTIHGFLTKLDATYGLTAESEVFLSKHSPAYIGSIANFLAHPRSISNFEDVAAVVRKGGPQPDARFTVPENDLWVEFARSMAPMLRPSAEALSARAATPGRSQKILDIAAGHGLFGINCATRNTLAEVVAVDWPNVLQVALENAQTAGVASRYHTISGSAFDADLGGGYDLVLLTNFLHHFDRAANVAFLKRVRAALKPGGTVITLEFIPNDDRVSPPVAASFSMIMLVNTPAGDAYTFRELDSMFREAGFGASRLEELEPTPSRLVISPRD